MQINFTGHGIQITDALRQLIEDKFQKISNHFSKTR
jgi:ribosomal subunit interface protein